MRRRTRRRNFIQREINHAIILKIAAEKTHPPRPVGAKGDPDKAVRTNTEELGPIIIAVFHAQAKSRGRTPDLASLERKTGLPGQLAQHGPHLVISISGFGRHGLVHKDRTRFNPSFNPACNPRLTMCALINYPCAPIADLQEHSGICPEPFPRNNRPRHLYENYLHFFPARCAYFGLCAAVSTNLHADHLIIVVKPVAPFVIEDNGKFSGYSIDLWSEVAHNAGWTDFEYRKGDPVPAMLDALKSGQADVGVGALSITSERSKEIDFSHPFYDSGLDILVKGGGAPGPLDLLMRLLTPSLVLTFGGIMIALVIVSHILSWFERKHNHEDFPHHYGAGMIESIWWTTCVLIGAMCMSKDPKGLTGRIIGTAWALVGIAMISYLDRKSTR